MKLLIGLVILLQIHHYVNSVEAQSKNSKNPVIDDISDMKDFKKLLRSKNNVLVMFVSSTKEAQSQVKIFKDSAVLIKGMGTMVLVDCLNGEMKKLCKKIKVSPQPVLMKHYKDGDFHKDYDRQMIASSIVNFMREPTGDLPWEEDPIGADVVHIQDATTLGKFLKRESRPIMVMFYAPWCGFCKQLKPDYSAAATEVKNKAILAAIDVNRPENTVIRKLYNITGFPTLLYYESGELKYTYEGENNKAGIVSFMQNPRAAPVIKPKEADWASETNSEIVHLTSNNFDPALKDEKSVLVMFYAPWCGHCKRMKPEYEKAAEIMREKNIGGVLAALDATKESAIAGKFNVKGYPTVKYFSNGEFKFDVNVRDAEKIIEFMKNPSEPPPPPPAEKPWEDEPSAVVHLNDESFKGFLKKKKHVIVMFYAPWCGHCKKAKPEFATAAENYKDDPRIELAAVDCTQHSALCSQYQIKGYPTIKYFSYLKTMRDYTGGRLSADFIRFLSNPDSSSADKQVAEPFGTYPGSDFVVILDDKNFDNKLKKESKALVMFYAPWCGHCKEMKGAYSLLAEKLVKNNVGIAGALDSTIYKTVSERFSVNGFPTLKYFENGVFKRDYSGKRTAEDMYLFVKNGGVGKKDEL